MMLQTKQVAQKPATLPSLKPTPLLQYAGQAGPFSNM